VKVLATLHPRDSTARAAQHSENRNSEEKVAQDFRVLSLQHLKSLQRQEPHVVDQ
jgi:hypothetical protein